MGHKKMTRAWTESDTQWFRACIYKQGGLKSVAKQMGIKKSSIDAWSRRGVPAKWAVRLGTVLEVDPKLLSVEAFHEIAKPWPGSALQGTQKTEFIKTTDHVLLAFLATCINLSDNAAFKDDIRAVAQKHFSVLDD